MTESDRIGNSGNFNILGGFHRLRKCARRARKQREKRANVCTVMVLLSIYSKLLGVRFPVFKVLMIIKVCEVYSKKRFAWVKIHSFVHNIFEPQMLFF